MQRYKYLKKEAILAHINLCQHVFSTLPTHKPNYTINGNDHFNGKTPITIIPHFFTARININKAREEKNQNLQNSFHHFWKIEIFSFVKHIQQIVIAPLYLFKNNFHFFFKNATTRVMLNNYLSIFGNVIDNETKNGNHILETFFLFFNQKKLYKTSTLLKPFETLKIRFHLQLSFIKFQFAEESKKNEKETEKEKEKETEKEKEKEKEKIKTKTKERLENKRELNNVYEERCWKNQSNIDNNKSDKHVENVNNVNTVKNSLNVENEKETSKEIFSTEQKEQQEKKKTQKQQKETNEKKKLMESHESIKPSIQSDPCNFNQKKENEEDIHMKELEHFFAHLQKLYENKNSKINMNIKILIHLFNSFIIKNKNLKIKMALSFVFLIFSKISVIYTPLFLSSFIENVNLEKSLQDGLNIITNEEKQATNGKTNLGFLFLSSYIVSRILSSGLTELRNTVFNSISQKIATYVSKLFFYKIHSLNLSYILSKKNGELSFIFNRGCKSITNLLNITAFQIIPIILEFVLYLFILTYKIHYNVSFVTCFNMLLYILFTTIVTKKRTLIRKNMNKAEQNTSNIFLDSIQNIEQVKYHTNEIHELKKFLKEQKKYEKEAINVQKSLSFLNCGQQIILNFNLFLCLYLTYVNILNNVFPFSYIILVNTLLFQLAIPLNMFGTIYRETKLSLVDIESMIKILLKKKKDGNTKKIEHIYNGAIRFENVYFNYPVVKENVDNIKPNTQMIENKISNIYQTVKKKFIHYGKRFVFFRKQSTVKEDLENTTQILTVEETETNKKILLPKEKKPQYLFENFSCHIDNGDSVGIIGKSGAGKSSLIKLLFKFYDINSGNIYIGNANIKDINLYALRKNICIVPQDTILFNNTIAYNIKYGNLQCSDEEMIDASMKSELHDKILKMEKKYDTVVGERGTKLSKGETQRICIARCFLKNPKIIILDEHVSNLDNENKKSIDRALQNLCSGKTTLTITHVMENLNKFNKILFLCDRNISVGTHDELMQNNIQYQRFYNSKNNNYCEYIQ